LILVHQSALFLIHDGITSSANAFGIVKDPTRKNARMKNRVGFMLNAYIMI